MAKRPIKHADKSSYTKAKARKGRFRFIHKKKRETSEILKAMVR